MANEFISNTKAGNNYSKGWKLTISAFWTLLAVVLILLVINLPTELQGQNPALGYVLFTTLWSVFLYGPISMSASWVFLKAARQEKFKIGDMFAVFTRNYWNAVGAGLVVGLIIIGGLILLIVPGIIFAIRLSFVQYLIIDRKMPLGEAISTSWKMTKGRSWTIFGMALLAILIAIAGLIVIGIGVFFSMVWISASFAVLYASVEKAKKK